jgi:hypothetical protein
MTATNIRPDYILVQHTIVRGVEHDTPKTLYRIRKIPITQAIRTRLDVIMERSTGEMLVTTKTGTMFRPANFRKDIWEKAGKAGGITDKVPYSLRHSFAAWALTLRIDPNRLVRLMGHGSKKMIYEGTGITSKGLKRISGTFWNTTAGTLPNRRKNNQQQSDTVKQFPSRCNRLIYRNKTKPRIFHLKPFGESFSESRGKKKGITNDSL